MSDKPMMSKFEFGPVSETTDLCNRGTIFLNNALMVPASQLSSLKEQADKIVLLGERILSECELKSYPEISSRQSASNGGLIYHFEQALKEYRKGQSNE